MKLKTTYEWDVNLWGGDLALLSEGLKVFKYSHYHKDEDLEQAIDKVIKMLDILGGVTFIHNDKDVT